MKQIRFYCEAVESVALRDWEVRLATRYGGFTKHRAQGAYVNSKGILEFENSFVFEIIANDAEPWFIAHLATQLRDALNQESVLYTISDVEGKLV